MRAGTSASRRTRRDHRCRGCCCSRRGTPSQPILGRRRVPNLFGNIFSGPKAGQRRRQRSAPGRHAAGAPPPWSGEDGASGHPLMTARAIREAAANFDNCVAAMWPDAARRNISQQSFERFTAGLEPDLRIMDLMDSAARIHQGDLGLSRHPRERQPPRQGPRDPRQVQAAVRRGGKSLWRRPLHRSRRSGASRSNYSTQMGDRSVLQSTATLACIGRRQNYFRDEFLSALEILHRGDLRPGAAARLLGRRVRADAVHADRVQALRRRCRRRRPPRRGRQSRRPDRVDRQQSEEGRLADRPELGL